VDAGTAIRRSDLFEVEKMLILGPDLVFGLRDEGANAGGDSSRQPSFPVVQTLHPQDQVASRHPPTSANGLLHPTARAEGSPVN
jgi:hypothetical protein